MELVSVVGLILAVEGNAVTVDNGLIDGLQVQDTGIIYYTLTVSSQNIQITVTEGEVIKVDDFDATLRVADASKVRAGYLVGFEIPKNRVASEALLRIDSDRAEKEQFDDALRYLNKIREQVPDDPFVDQQIRQLQEKKREYERRQEELEKIDYYRAAAQDLFDQDDLEGSRAYLRKILDLAPDDPAAQQLIKRLDIEQKRTTDMLLIPGGIYAIGVDLRQAKFYSQYPRFHGNLKFFRIDAKPESLIGVSFGEAVNHCRSLGKRLPTELEWEVAAQQEGFEGTPLILEWTSSWYQPYPGNVIWEPEYGEKFRVLRRTTDFQRRFFMAPEMRGVDVGFRCASDAPETTEVVSD